MANTRGGKRTGAGRKRGIASIKAEEARKYAVERIVAEIDPILTAQIEAAKGAFYEVDGKDGVKTIYQREPDLKAGMYLANQLIGHPKETAEITVIEPFSLKALERERRNLPPHIWQTPSANSPEVSEGNE